ncbi:MAG: efflux RND transporter periplasmic adaptor subunit [Actinomycetota bacterium]
MRHKKILLFLAAAIMLTLALSSCQSEPSEDLETFTAARGDIVHTVTSTGHVEALDIRNYSLQASGEVLLALEKGQAFSAGDLLFKMDNQMTQLSIEQAEENLAISESSLSQAKVSYQQALDNNHIAVQLAKGNKTLAGQNTENALISLQDAQKLVNKSNAYSRAALESAEHAVAAAQINVEAAQQAVADTRNILEEAEDDPFYNDTQIAQYESSLNNAQSNLESTQVQEESARIQAEMAQLSHEQSKAQSSSQVHSAEGAFEQVQINQSMTYWSTLGETQNAEKQIGLAREAINQAESQLNLARINVEMASLDLDKNKVVAPFDGMVLASPFSEGELASPGINVLSVISDDFIIASNIDETDIDKLEIGQEVSFTLDAYHDRQYSGKVIEISPIPENIGGIVTFQIRVKPDDYDGFLYGLTANLTVSSIQAEDVLLAPIEAVYEEERKQYVDILKEGDIVTTEVITGAFSYDYIEIVSGLQKGDEIIISRIENE